MLFQVFAVQKYSRHLALSKRNRQVYLFSETIHAMAHVVQQVVCAKFKCNMKALMPLFVNKLLMTLKIYRISTRPIRPMATATVHIFALLPTALSVMAAAI